VVLVFDTQNLSRDGVLLVQPVNRHPRERPESPIWSRKEWSIGALDKEVVICATVAISDRVLAPKALFGAADAAMTNADPPSTPRTWWGAHQWVASEAGAVRRPHADRCGKNL
jgi:hypothetical protein